MRSNYRDDDLLVEQDNEMEDEFEDTEDEEGLWIEIGGERYGIEDTIDLGGDIVELVFDNGDRWIVASDSDAAADFVKDRWREMDDRELVAMIGAETIVDSWIRGQSFEKWLDEYIRYDGPAAELASYDGNELDVDEVSPNFVEEVGFDPTVAYRAD